MFLMTSLHYAQFAAEEKAKSNGPNLHLFWSPNTMEGLDVISDEVITLCAVCSVEDLAICSDNTISSGLIALHKPLNLKAFALCLYEKP